MDSMDAATFPEIPVRRDTLSGTLLSSILLHGFLLFVAVTYAYWGIRFGRRGGENWSPSGAMRVGSVTSLPGVPLPAPMLATPNTVANENPGLYQSEPKPLPPPPPTAVQIPKFQEEVKPEKTIRINKRIQKQELTPPDNAIPTGLGGHPQMTTGQISNAAGQGMLNFGGGSFADRYGWYINAVRNRISSNWLLALISPNILTAPRVYLTFEIMRDGTIEGARITQSSGIPEVDRSALRAILASNPLGPLPPDYSGASVSVDFYFDFQRH